MSENTKIEWCDHTFNPWIGCTKVSAGCTNCYAESMDRRWGHASWGKGAPRRRTSAANWKLPGKWDKAAGETVALIKADIGNASEYNSIEYERPRVFCASLADWLDDEVPVEWLADLLALIHATPNLDWLLLTKRQQLFKGRMSQAYDSSLNEDLRQWLAHWYHSKQIPSNIWLGTTVENQEMGEKRIWELLQIPAKVRFLSCEPLLEYVDLGNLAGINWVICGGESGPKARPMHPDWARSMRDQCQAEKIPFFMKQMGGTRKPFTPIPEDLNIRQFPQ